ncbi:MAG: hypothetical protein JWO13_2407 [Acidobacteriales bacterium]|nr:hypothetical protein [Terriglobales bacterium]
MENRAERLKRAIIELKQIDIEVLFPTSETKFINDDSAEGSLLFELKGVVDDLRTSIWCRMKQTAQSDEETMKMVDHYRMRRVVQMLRQIRTSERQPSKEQRPISDFQRIQSSAEAAVQIHFLASNNVH